MENVCFPLQTFQHLTVCEVRFIQWVSSHRFFNTEPSARVWFGEVHCVMLLYHQSFPQEDGKVDPCGYLNGGMWIFIFRCLTFSNNENTDPYRLNSRDRALLSVLPNLANDVSSERCAYLRHFCPTRIDTKAWRAVFGVGWQTVGTNSDTQLGPQEKRLYDEWCLELR